jgi:hypothetical protein
LDRLLGEKQGKRVKVLVKKELIILELFDPDGEKKNERSI